MEVSAVFDTLRVVVPVTLFFGTVLLWIWRLLEAKRKEDKVTFIDLYNKYNIITGEVQYLKGRKDAELEHALQETRKAFINGRTTS